MTTRRYPHNSGAILWVVLAWVVIAGLVMLARLPLVIWHKTGPHGQLEAVTATYVAYLVSGAVIVGSLMFLSIRSANRREVAARRAAPASGPPMTSMPPTAAESRAWAEAGAFALPARPLCMHLGAVKVNSSVHEDLIYHCWCPDCGEELPANWRRLCCGTEPEAKHVYNCPQGRKDATR